MTAAKLDPVRLIWELCNNGIKSRIYLQYRKNGGRWVLLTREAVSKFVQYRPKGPIVFQTRPLPAI